MPAREPDLRVLQIWLPLIAALVVVTSPAGLVLAPVPVALCVARGRLNLAVAACAAMAAASAVGFWAPEGAAPGFIASAFGIPVGVWAARGVPFVRILARTAAMASMLVVGAMAATTAQVQTSLESAIEEFERRFDDAGSAIDPAAADRVLAFQRQIVEHWPYLLPGAAVAGVLAAVALAIALLQRLLLRAGGPPIPGKFQDVRPPDWLVWLAIASALAWFVDREMPSESLRLISWNSGIVLAGIYWLNGLAVLAALAGRFRAPQLLVPVALIVLLLPHMNLMLAMVGFFDTWIEFRRRLAGLPPESNTDDNE